MFPAVRQVSGVRRVVWICGQPASGKSWLAERLAASLAVPAYSIDGERCRLLRPGERWPSNDVLAWLSLKRAIDGQPRCIVETGGMSGREGTLFAGVSVFTIGCSVRRPVQVARLRERSRRGYWMARGERGYARRLAEIPAPTVPVAMIWDSSETPTSEAAFRAVANAARMFLFAEAAEEDVGKWASGL